MTSSQRTIGMIAASVSGSYFRMLIGGLYQAVRARGAKLILISGTPQEVVEQRLAHDRVDGWVTVLNPPGLAALAALGRPVITISHHEPGLSAVVLDNQPAVAALVTHLIGLGRRRIAFLGALDDADVPERLAGYREALAAHGLALDTDLLIDARNTVEDATHAVAARWASGQRFDALVSATDHMAFGAYDALRAAGVAIPQEVALTGFDDVPMSQLLEPPLTTVRLRFDAMGQLAATRLLDEIDGRALGTATISVPTTLIIRQSCGSRADSLPPSATAETDPYRRLTSLLLAPLPLGPADLPETVWPEGRALLDTIDAAVTGVEPPSNTQLQRAWAAAQHLSPYGESYVVVVEELERFGAVQLAARNPTTPARERLSLALRRIRHQLFQLSTGFSSHGYDQLEATLYGARGLIDRLAAEDLGAVQQLSWIAANDATGACLGLWRAAERTELDITGAVGVASGTPGGACPASSFPPALPAGTETDVWVVAPVRSRRRDWGLLAVVRSFAQQHSYEDGTTLWATLLAARLDDAVLVDEIERRVAEGEQQLQRERALRQTVLEIGTPVIPLTDRLLLLPLVGTIDAGRAQQLLDVTLAAVSAQRASHILLDVSGVPLVDTYIAGVLIRLGQMAGLLGAQTALVGIRPEIAQSIIGLGMNLGAIRSFPSVAVALRALRDAAE